ncbi:MAG: beta-glucuronidase [Clostridia bacterium]|nr:beta-glucuronidase [Clostridia bacterium]
MTHSVDLPRDLPFLRKVDSRLVSYNIEMTEVTGGTFWKEYTPQQIEGRESFSVSGLTGDFTAVADLMQYYPPIDLSHPRLRAAAKALGPAWVRVSGSWATKTYYDFEGITHGTPPEGYASVLTKEQWAGVLDFVSAVGAKLLISVSNCAGDHPGGGPLDLTQTKKIFDFSHAYGVEIDACEFMNEPNMLEFSGAPKGYTAEDFVRDQDIFNGWVREHYPNCLIVGPCTLGDGALGKGDVKRMGAGIGSGMKICSTHDLLQGARVPLDVFSYHYYNGVSERLASVMPSGHWNSEDALSDAYLSVATENVKTYLPLRDRYVPGSPLWVTESGDAGGGGNTWASTYLDVFRTLNELGSFASLTDGVIFHNTLASSDYGFLRHTTFSARPNYYAVLLWNRIMGQEVFDASSLCEKDLKVYCHSRKDGAAGMAYLVINTSEEERSLRLPGAAEVYRLSAETLRSPILQLNGEDLAPDLEFASFSPVPCRVAEGSFSLPSASCAFFVV